MGSGRSPQPNWSRENYPSRCHVKGQQGSTCVYRRPDIEYKSIDLPSSPRHLLLFFSLLPFNLIIESSVEGEGRIEEKFLPGDLKFTLTQGKLILLSLLRTFTTSQVGRFHDLFFPREQIQVSQRRSFGRDQLWESIAEGATHYTHTHNSCL